MASRAYWLATEHGVLPWPGGIEAQPGPFIDLVQIVDEVRSQSWDERVREAEAKRVSV